MGNWHQAKGAVMGPFQTLKNTEPFVHLPDAVIQELSTAAIVKAFPPNFLIFKHHDPPTGFLYVIKEGLVEIVTLTPGGLEMVMDYRQAGSFFGGTPIFMGDNYTAGARTVNPTECYLIPQEVLTDIARRYPHIIEHFSRAILSRVRRLYSDMVESHAQSALTPVEAYPFKKRLSEIMSAPLEVCSPQTPVREVARRMTERGIGAMVVTDEEKHAVGIITQTDLIGKVLVQNSIDIGLLTAADIMTANPLAMTPDNYMFEAAAFMISHNIRHLPILAQRKLVGIVTLQNLMRYRSQNSMLLVNSIKEASSLSELASANAQIVQIAKAFMAEARSHFETLEVLSYIHHCILRRCFELVLNEFHLAGKSPPNIRYCLMIMGSGGRKEMLLGPDQDNGFIYEDFPDSRLNEVEAFFGPFSERLTEAFEQVGYPKCNGNVMASNPLWRGRLKDWHARISNWIQVPEPKKVMYSTIFFDFMPLVGDPELCQDLREILYRELQGNTVFLYYLLENDLKHAPPVGLLGRFLLEKDGEHKGELSLKQAGSVFIVDCVRMFMLEKGIYASTTVQRLDELVKLNVFNQETAEHIKAALEVFFFFRLRQEISLLHQGKSPSHYINPYSLTRNEQDLLQESFRTAGKLQDSVRRHFSHGLR
jgi:CBS domain-containing protein